MATLFHGSLGGSLELRATTSGQRLSGRFPYRSRAVLSDGGQSGRPQKEEFAPRAFEYRVLDETAEIHLLSGHSYDKPLASKLNGSLKLRDTDDALEFDALISPEVAQTTHARDVLALILAGLAVGISPGFRLPPERAVPRKEAEEFEDEEIDPPRGMHGARIRKIKQALLYELSIVTAPAYPEAKIEPRSAERAVVRRALALNRWRV
jgi:HK97 family phage prohead protease